MTAVFSVLIAVLLAGAAAAQPVDSLRADSLARPVEIARPASVVLLPVLSAVVPGFGQLAQRRFAEGGAYAAAGVSGIVLASTSGYSGNGSLEDALLDRKGARVNTYGLELYQGAGFLSAWDAFQASVPALQQDKGTFLFMNPQNREKPLDLMLAPFRLDYLIRPTTFVPLGVLAALSVLGVSAYRADNGSEGRWLSYTPDDAFFTGAISMNAGVTEEAVFRGYLFPVFHQWSGQRYWVSNTGQSLLFAVAHLGSTPFPIAQGALGFYLGILTAKNDWRIGQGVAIHFWWDVIAVSANLFTRQDVPVSLGSFSVPVNL